MGTLFEVVGASGLVRLVDGSLANPVLSFISEPGVGFYRVSTETLGYSANGDLSLTLNANGLYGVNGTEALPSISFISDPDTGIFKVATNALAISAGGARAILADPTAVNFYVGGSIRWQIDNDTFTASGNRRIRSGDGSAASPAYSFADDPDTGAYSSGANQFSVSAGAVQRLRVGSSSAFFATVSSGTTQNALRLVHAASATSTGVSLQLSLRSEEDYTWRLASIATNGSPSLLAPTLTFGIDNGAGTFTERLQITADGQTLFSNGTSALPGLSFISDPDTGFFRSAANTLSISCGGAERAYFDSQGIGMRDGTAAAPSYHFFNDPDTGLYRGGANLLDVATAGNRMVRFGASTTADATDQDTMIVSNGPVGTTTGMRNRCTADVSTSATTIATINQYCNLVLVSGIDGSAIFGDVVFAAFGVASPVVIASRNSGSPAARTYTQSSGNLQLAMGSGTYDVTTFQIEQRTSAF